MRALCHFTALLPVALPYRPSSISLSVSHLPFLLLSTTPSLLPCLPLFSHFFIFLSSCLILHSSLSTLFITAYLFFPSRPLLPLSFARSILSPSLSPSFLLMTTNTLDFRSSSSSFSHLPLHSIFHVHCAPKGYINC